MGRRAGEDHLAVPGERAHDAARLRHGRAALRAVAPQRAASDRRAPRRGGVHREGGRGRVPPWCQRRVRDRGRALRVAVAPARLPAVHRRLADDPDPRDRTDGRRLDQPEAARVARRLGGRVRDLRLPDVLPGDDQHAPRAPVGRPACGGADALVRREPLEDPLEAPCPRIVPVPVHGAEDRGASCSRGRDHRRAALVDPGRSRRGDPELQPVLRQLAAEPLGDEHHRGGARDPLLQRRRDRGAAARPPSTGERRVTDAAAVSVKNLSKRFERGDVLALDRIDLDVQPGEFVSLIGPSGCGKSTLLRIIGDLIHPTEGEILVNGKPVHQARLDRDYGIVFQDAVLFDWRNVAEEHRAPA